MKQTIAVTICTILLLSCQSEYDLQGRWAGRDPDGDYMELWFSDSLSLSYFQSYDEFVLYSYKRNGSDVLFKVIDSQLEGQNSFSNIIVGLDQDTLILQYDYPNGAIQRFNYQRISASVPTIYNDEPGKHREEYLETIYSGAVEQ